MKKTVCMFLTLTLLSLSVSGFAYYHEWSDWEWEISPTCYSAGRQVRVCTLPNCGSHERRTVAAVPHEFNEATCTSPAACRFGCGTTQGSALGHDYAPATCISPMTCTRCGNENGGLGQHQFCPASCTIRSTCSICGYETGGLLAHNYSEATCTRKATCTVCGATTGDLLPHAFVNGVCVMCHKHEFYYNGTPGESE